MEKNNPVQLALIYKFLYPHLIPTVVHVPDFFSFVKCDIFVLFLHALLIIDELVVISDVRNPLKTCLRLLAVQAFRGFEDFDKQSFFPGVYLLFVVHSNFPCLGGIQIY